MIPPRHSYRDFVRPASQAYLSDESLLERVAADGQATPGSLARNRHRENVLRLQCRDLARVGFLSRVTVGTYQLARTGREFLAGRVSWPVENGLLDLEALSRGHSGRRSLSDFSILDAETIKQINLDELRDPGTEYGLVQGTIETTERRISNVRDSRIHRLLREFPTRDPLPEQCAHWMRAFAGLHLFPDANHRTGMNTLQVLVETNDVDASLPVRSDVERFVLHSKLIRHLHADVRFSSLWQRDEQFLLWLRYFRAVFYGTTVPRKPSTEHLREVLTFARQNPSAILGDRDS